MIGDQRYAFHALRAAPIWAMACTLIGPSTGWPPVIATASLKRIL
jgi:hypothetical protein